MSLINDALKRANEAQQMAEQTPRPDLKFRGVDQQEAGPKKHGWVWQSALTAAVLIGIFFTWEVTHRAKEQPAPPAQQEKAVETGSILSPKPLKVYAREPEALPGAPLASSKTPDAARIETVAVVAVSGTTIQETTKGENTNASPAMKAPGPRLQGIVFNPASPSATINGKAVFVGEKVGEWRVAAIEKDSATLVSGGETNVLKLEQ